ncbi:MAG: hypothetical protein V7603_5139 [Micromonosporaceae bacterium]
MSRQRLRPARLGTPTRRPGILAVLSGVVLAMLGCGTGKPAPSPYACGTPSAGHCYGTTLGPPAQGRPTGGSMLMNTLTVDGSGRGDLFFTDEMWLDEGFNDIRAWVEAGQIYDLLGLRYFWAQLRVAPNRDPLENTFTSYSLGPVTATDATAGTTVGIRRTAPDAFAVRILASGSSYSAQTVNHMWTRTKDFGSLTIGLELAGTTGAFAQPVSMQPRWWDTAGALHEWSLPVASSPDPPQADPPIHVGWLLPPGPQGAIWLTSCCTKPSSALGPQTADRLGAGAAEALIVKRNPVKPPPVPEERPPSAAVGVAPRNVDVVANPDSLPQAVRDGLLGKIGATSNVTVTRSGCDPASVVTQHLPGQPTAGLDPTRSLCWFELAGKFGVATPPSRSSASTTLQFDAAYAVFDAQTHSLLSAGAFHPTS